MVVKFNDTRINIDNCLSWNPTWESVHGDSGARPRHGILFRSTKTDYSITVWLDSEADRDYILECIDTGLSKDSSFISSEELLRYKNDQT